MRSGDSKPSVETATPATGAEPAERLGSSRAITVLLVDDQPLLRSGFAMILSTEPDIDVVGTAANGIEAIARVEALHPDVVLMDVQMPVLDGIEATRQIMARARARARSVGQAPTKVVILTTFDRDDYLFDALDAGASGFLLKNAEADDMVEGVRTVHEGHALLAPEVTRRVIAAAHPRFEHMRNPGHGADTEGDDGAGTEDGDGRTDGARLGVRVTPGRDTEDEILLASLTAREREVLATMAAGLSNAEIAATLFLSEATVKSHVSRILTKLSVRDRVQAVIAAYRGGLVPPTL
ncbi:MAG: response regulator transcription factor [Ornithinimicrobium sp.]